MDSPRLVPLRDRAPTLVLLLVLCAGALVLCAPCGHRCFSLHGVQTCCAGPRAASSGGCTVGGAPPACS